MAPAAKPLLAEGSKGPKGRRVDEAVGGGIHEQLEVAQKHLGTETEPRPTEMSNEKGGHGKKAQSPFPPSREYVFLKGQ
jgi:hypothetical protein